MSGCGRGTEQVGRVQLRVEPLESRLLLDGDVSLAFIGGAVTITGDGGNNEVVLEQGTGQVTFSSRDGTTTINGSLDPYVFSGDLSSVRADMGDGEDFVEAFGVQVAGDFVFDGGEGESDGCNLIASVHIGGDVRLDYGQGDDWFCAWQVTIDGSVYISTGRTPASDYSQASFSLIESSVGGDVTVRAGRGPFPTGHENLMLVMSEVEVGGSVQVRRAPGAFGNDMIQVIFCGVEGGISASSRRGDGDVLVNYATVGRGVRLRYGEHLTGVVSHSTVEGGVLALAGEGSLFVGDDSSVGGSVTALFSSGPADVELYRAQVLGHVVVRSGEGDDSLTITESNVHGHVTASTGDGAATTMIADSLIGGEWQVVQIGGEVKQILSDPGFGGNVVLRNGTGDVQTTIDDTTVDGSFISSNGHGGVHSTWITGSDIWRDVDVRHMGPVAVPLTAGAKGIIGDVFGLDDSWVGGNVAVRGGSIPDDVTVSRTAVDGTTNVSTGGGSDHVSIWDSWFGGRISVSTGGAPDWVGIERAGDDPPTVFGGRLRIDAGSDDDQILVGTPDADDWIDAERSVLFDGGSGYDTLEVEGNGNSFSQGYQDQDIESIT
jgi:hypothetical protein